MAEPAENLLDDPQPISLYFDLKKGARADLEVVAQTSIAFVQALKEAALEISPDFDIRVEVLDGTEGSLSLNAIISSVKSKTTSVTKADLRALSLAAVAWLGVQSAEWTYTKLADAIYSEVSPQAAQPAQPSASLQLTEQQLTTLAEKLNALQQSPEIQRRVGQIFSNAERDPAIIGLGVNVTRNPGRPSHIVSRVDFSKRRLDAREVLAVESYRVRPSEEIVKLVTAVLDPSSRRKWVITSSVGQRAAYMDDKEFLSKLSDGSITTRLNSNISLLVNLKISEKLVNREWKLDSVRIEKVRRIVLPKSEEDLLPPTSGDVEAGHK